MSTENPPSFVLVELLPMDVGLVFLEKVATLSDLLSLRRLSRAWMRWIDIHFLVWLKAQPIGVVRSPVRIHLRLLPPEFGGG